MSSPVPTPRGEPKRLAIVEAAIREFLDQGFAATSMDAIAARAGVSKRTVYNHYPAKLDLFRAVVAGLYEGLEAPERTGLGADQPPDQALPAFARAVLAHLRRPDNMALLRLVIAERHRVPELGLGEQAGGRGPALATLEAYLADQDRRGTLKVPRPRLAAQQFLGGIKEGVYWPALLGLAVVEDDDAIAAALAAFLAAYRPAP